MGPSLEKMVHELSMRMRLLRAMQEEEGTALSEREEMILRVLESRGKMTVSEIAAAIPKTSDSTISTSITKLWRDKGLVSKTICPENQRITIVELTAEGRDLIDKIRKQRAERFETLFRAIEMSDEEREVFLGVLRRAIDYMDKHLGFVTEVENV